MNHCSGHGEFADRLTSISGDLGEIKGMLKGGNGGGLVKQVNDTEKLARENHVSIVRMSGFRRHIIDLLKMGIVVGASLLGAWKL